MPEILPRHIASDVREALADTRVVAVLGARQVGKSTLIESVSAHSGIERIVTLDDKATRDAATADPTGFVANLNVPVAIDEVQRAPDLLLAIKQRVDADKAPGQFLLTGSANILTAPRIADALTGRAEYLTLWPFSQGELVGHRETFVSDLFEGRVPQINGAPIGRKPYAGLLMAGGYPEARRRSGRRRERFFDGYVETILQRDLSSIAQVHDQANVRRLLWAFAATSASPVNFSGLSRDLELPSNTLRAHADLLETLFLVRRLPPFSNNRLSRVVKAPKGYITDTGLLAFLLDIDETRIIEDGATAGMMFETFVAMELVRHAAWLETPVRAHHYRDKDGREVDIVLERRDGSIVGIEVKATATVGRRDFAGLRQLRDKLGDRFHAGVVIYTGANTLPFGDDLAAVPLQGLWG